MRSTWHAPQPISPPAAVVPDGLEVRGDGLGDALPHLDAEAQAAYRDRLGELRPELDAAQEAGDGERAARIEAEIDIIVSELSAAFGLGGRARKEGSAAERARQSVTKAIRDALRRIREEDVALGRTPGASRAHWDLLQLRPRSSGCAAHLADRSPRVKFGFTTRKTSALRCASPT